MAPADDPPSTTRIEARLQQLGTYSRFVKAGLATIVAAFVLAVVVVLPANAESLGSAFDAILMPLTFVGMGLLLFGIGMHLHLMHLNLVRQLRNDPETDATPARDRE